MLERECHGGRGQPLPAPSLPEILPHLLPLPVPSWSPLLPSPACGKFDAEVQEVSQDAAFYPSVMFQRQAPEALGAHLCSLLPQAECPGTCSLAVPSQVRGGC